MIEGVTVRKLERIPDERGTIMKMLEHSDSEFRGFGEVYFSTIYPGVVKGWHNHEDTWLNYCVIRGMIKLVLFDDREGSPTHGEIQELFIGDQNYALVQIPPRVWNAFKGIGETEAILCDLTDRPHAEDTIDRRGPYSGEIPYDWPRKDR